MGHRTGPGPEARPPSPSPTTPQNRVLQALCRHTTSGPWPEGGLPRGFSTGISPTSMLWATVFCSFVTLFTKDSRSTCSVPGLGLGNPDERQTTDWWETGRQTDREISRECTMQDQILGHLLWPSFQTFGDLFHMHLCSTYCVPAT